MAIHGYPWLFMASLCNELMFTWHTDTFNCFVILKFLVVLKVDHCRNFKITKQLKVAVYQVKTSSKHKRNKLRWLATDMSLERLHTGCDFSGIKIPSI